MARDAPPEVEYGSDNYDTVEHASNALNVAGGGLIYSGNAHSNVATGATELV